MLGLPNKVVLDYAEISKKRFKTIKKLVCLCNCSSKKLIPGASMLITRKCQELRHIWAYHNNRQIYNTDVVINSILYMGNGINVWV